MDFASGSAYGHQGLAQMRPVIVRQSGLTLLLILSTSAVKVLSWRLAVRLLTIRSTTTPAD
jgi:hypothetical protein